MVSNRAGVTLIELIVVLIIISIAAAFFFPDYTNNTALARAQVATNNLLAIYSAQQNYNNNNNGYCFLQNGGVCTSLADINAKLSLTLQDDGAYTYSCGLWGLVPSCQALNASYSANPITVFLTGANGAIQYPLSKNVNPYSGDCPGTKCPF